MTVASEDVRVDAPREDLIRMVPVDQAEMRAEIDGAGDGNTLYGYAAVFNEDTVIDSWEGRFIERIAPGAFRKTLREHSSSVKVLFNHGMDPQIGDKPLGRAAVMKEDDRGLYVEVPLSATSYNADIRTLLADGALDGMSFRMTVTREAWDMPKDDSGELPVRTIKEVRLYEFGPVTFPAYSATQAGVRAHAPRAFEAFRSAQGLPATPEISHAPATEATRDDNHDAPPAEHPSYTPTPPPAPPTPDDRVRQRRDAIDEVRRVLTRTSRSE